VAAVRRRANNQIKPAKVIPAEKHPSHSSFATRKYTYIIYV